MNIYIVHYKKLEERKAYLDSKLSGFNPFFIDEYDRDTLDLKNVSIKYNKNLWKERTGNLYSYVPVARDLKASEICNSLSHLEALRRISEDDTTYQMVLEDDAILPDDFSGKIEGMLLQTPPDFDFVFFGSSYSIPILDDANLSKSIRINDHIYKKEPGKTRTVDGYIVSKQAAKKLIGEITEICLPFDFELNYFLKKLNMTVYWYDPGIICQGSQTGLYNSSIRSMPVAVSAYRQMMKRPWKALRAILSGRFHSNRQ